MKRLFLFIALLTVSAVHGQGNFIKETNSSNPVSVIINLGSYRGAAWVDINNDGLIDLHAAPGLLFKNTGSGMFNSVVNPMGTASVANNSPASCSWSDYDNDGDLDCFVVSSKSRLFKNDGNGIFSVDSNIYNVQGDYPGWAGSLGDINNDSRMDAVVAYANGFLPGTSSTACIFFKQDASGKLNTVTGFAFTDSLAPYTVPYWSDFDLDGDMDLFIASGPAGTPGYDYCYRNLKIETGLDSMERISNLPFANDMQDGQCYNFIDYDNDEDLDLCLTNYGGALTRLYQNNNGVYQSISCAFANTAPRLSNCWGDYDNDGDLDVIMLTDAALVKYYRNDGNNVFTSINYAITTKIGGACAANCDYDNDGDLDVFIMGTGTAKGLFINDSIGYGNQWVNIKCIGTTSNKAAIGTLVRLKCTINGNSVWQIREINAQNSFMGQNDLRVHFGLGNATIIDSIQIKYLGGNIETFSNVAVNQFYSNTEGTGILSTTTSIPSITEGRAWLFLASPNPAKNYIQITTDASLNNKHVIYFVSDIQGKVVLSAKKWNAEMPLKINTSQLDSGIYFINLTIENEQQSLRFVKE